ncbi:MAG: EAL domain-containing protein [Butyrivibrio sp.]|nr:EAL domain-containing protein [Butyrivibrio sp.]
MDQKFNYDEKMKRFILIVDDEFVNREILGGVLEEEYNLYFAEDGEVAMNILKENKKTISLVLLDLKMPKLNGFEVIKLMKADSMLKKIPIIVLTSEKEAEVESLKLGASDFITKPYDMPEIIITRVKRLIELSEDRLIIKSAERDELTGLYSKTFFYEYAHIMNKFKPDSKMDALVFDIDHFHLINEIYGRNFGDDVLKKLAQILKDYAAKLEGLAGRGEADIFFLYVNHLDDYNDLENTIQKELLDVYKGNNIHIRIGVCEKTSDIKNIEQLCDRAKLACNTIRGKFQKRLAYFDEDLKQKTFFNERLIHDMHDGLEKKQFVAFYQPKYEVYEGEPVLKGAEALVRWNHPDFGLVSPGAFISLFEENGLIQLVDNYIWKETARQLKKWKKAFKTNISVSVNVSRIDIYDPDIEKKLIKIIKDNGLDIKDFHIEITESAYADNAKQLIRVVEGFRQAGFIIEMDDFGTGYSALNMLSSLPIDILKLDMQFVKTMLEDEKNLRMVEIVMDIARLLDVPVVAEGVETKEQLDKLIEMGCHMVQGYYFSKPVAADEFEKFLKETKNADDSFFKRIWRRR